MFKFDTIESAIEALRNGEIIIVTDDDGRENEGDLICAAEHATPANIDFMITYAKGLICMPMEEDTARRLAFPKMVTNDEDPHGTAFTVSVDHVRSGTGISAQMRSITALEIVNPEATAADFNKPGHMFPLIAKPWGVLERDGHTEATVDLCKLAGLKPVGLCCEILADSTTTPISGADASDDAGPHGVMKRDQLIKLAQDHNLRFVTIRDLIAYRKRTEVITERVSSIQMPTKHGLFTAHSYLDRVSGEHHVALVKGNPTGENVLCRVHSECLTGDAFGSLRCDCGEQYASAMESIENEGTGVMLYLRQEGRGIGLIEKLKAYALQDQGMDTVEANLALGHPEDMREYHIAAQMLADLKITSLRLMTNNPEKVTALESYGIKILERLPIEIEANEYDKSYLQVKKDKMGHWLNVN